MTQAENLVAEPITDGGIDLWKLADKKVIGAFHNNELILAGKRCSECFHLRDRAIFVIAPVHEEFWLVALP